MRFDWPAPTDRLTLEDQHNWSRIFADVTFACVECDSEDTVEIDQRVPAGTHLMVRCPAGHVTVGIPPARFRRPQTDEGRPQA
ncbi:MAG: hypothetical protein JWR58_5763 [Pseudonocardia sp.]|nr:hypothetical protein [Pseudonocardia sp.]